MNKTLKNSLLMMTLCAGTMAAGFHPALADPPHKDKHKNKSHNSYRLNGDDQRVYRNYMDVYDQSSAVIVIQPDNRQVIRDYMAVNYRTSCPPGLAKKNNGCLPPGIAKKYRVGYPLGDNVAYYPIDRDLLARLGTVPAGYQYVRVDQDILLMSEASKKIIDAVTLLSAVGS